MIMKYKIIIPSAKVVPAELQKIGKLPAIIYPINQKMVFDYLYKQYKEKCDFMKIICHEEADKVHQFLSKYAGEKLIIENLPVLDDLGHTIYYALRDIDNPIVINFADTIVLDDIMQMEKDAYFYSLDYYSDIWTYFEEKKGVITAIYDKIPATSMGKGKLFVGVFKLAHTVFFKKCLEMAFITGNRRENTLYYALKKYSEKYPMKAVKTDNWFDIGHADKYYHSNLEVRAREFNHISIDKRRGILRKSSDDTDKFIGEIKWYLKLPSAVEYVRPRIFEYSTAYDGPYISMEYYAYHTLHELFLYGDLTPQQWLDIFENIRFVCKDFGRYRVRDSNIRSALEDMYLTKTLQRLENLSSDAHFKKFFDRPIQVNGVDYKSLEYIVEILVSQIPELLYDIDTFQIIHGDLCFSNIMVDGNFTFIKLIDPRGKFGAYNLYGDFRYELAKLLHSVDGRYDFIINDLFELKYDLQHTTINYTILNSKRSYDLYKIFIKVFQDEIGRDLKKIELIEALLFLSMIPLHSESLEHQLLMLGRGIEILDRVLNVKL